MGLLDDAIREHLELKRRHGADPGEVARQESEALGPVRRSAETAQASTAIEAEPEPEFAFDDDLPEPVFEAEPEYEPIFEPEPEPEPIAAEPEPQPAPEPVARRAEDTIDQPTVEHPSARPEPDPATGDEDDDVLEGTPEFLEETPEHDRLWFEQRPPRDFDFDD